MFVDSIIKFLEKKTKTFSIAAYPVWSSVTLTVLSAKFLKWNLLVDDLEQSILVINK